MRIGYICRYRYPDSKEEFEYKEANFTRRITSKSDRIYSKLIRPCDYDEVESNTKILKENTSLILVQEPFLVDNELKQRVTKWVEWANNSNRKDYDPFYNGEV